MCRLRTRLGHALTLLKTYQHKVRHLDAAMAAQEKQRAQARAPLSEARHTQTEECERQPGTSACCELPELPVAVEPCGVHGMRCARCSGPLCAADAAGVQERTVPASQRSNDGQPAFSRGEEQQVSACASLASSKAGDDGDGRAFSASLLQAVAAAQSHAGEAGGSAADESGPALSAGQTLRFDPTAGECGAFFIVSHSAGNAAASKAPAAEGGRSHDVRPDSQQLRGSQLRPGLEHDAACGPSKSLDRGPREQHGPPMGKAQSCRADNTAACSDWQGLQVHFDGSLLDLVAEVEEIVSHRDGQHAASNGNGQGQVRGDIAWRHEYCQEWLGALGNDVLSLISEQEHSLRS